MFSLHFVQSSIFLLNLSNIRHEGAKRNGNSVFLPRYFLLLLCFLPVEVKNEASLYVSSVTQLQGRQKSSVPKNIHPPLFLPLCSFHPNLQSPRPLALHSELFSPFSLPFPIWAMKACLLFFSSLHTCFISMPT